MEHLSGKPELSLVRQVRSKVPFFFPSASRAMGTSDEGEQPLGRPIEFFPFDGWKSDDTEMDGRYATLKQRLVVVKVRLDDQSVG